MGAAAPEIAARWCDRAGAEQLRAGRWNGHPPWLRAGAGFVLAAHARLERAAAALWLQLYRDEGRRACAPGHTRWEAGAGAVAVWPGPRDRLDERSQGAMGQAVGDLG